MNRCFPFSKLLRNHGEFSQKWKFKGARRSRLSPFPFCEWRFFYSGRLRSLLSGRLRLKRTPFIQRRRLGALLAYQMEFGSASFTGGDIPKMQIELPGAAKSYVYREKQELAMWRN